MDLTPSRLGLIPLNHHEVAAVLLEGGMSLLTFADTPIGVGYRQNPKVRLRLLLRDVQSCPAYPATAFNTARLNFKDQVILITINCGLHLFLFFEIGFTM